VHFFEDVAGNQGLGGDDLNLYIRSANDGDALNTKA
jgi:hypothetical protein